MRTALRAATAAAHKDLEQALGLLEDPLSRSRFVALLERFWGFHAVWEPAIGQHAPLRSLMAGRYRLAQIADDLRALGLTQQEIMALPQCSRAAGLAISIENALGSLYVLEGSTLGGQIITRALRDQPWVPPSGLRYFDPYGPETGARWRALQAALSAASAPSAEPAIIAGAVRTFELLRAWLVPG